MSHFESHPNRLDLPSRVTVDRLRDGTFVVSVRDSASRFMAHTSAVWFGQSEAAALSKARQIEAAGYQFDEVIHG